MAGGQRAKDKAARTRKARTYRRRDGEHRAALAVSDADQRRADLLVDELALAQLLVIPEDERRTGWQDQHDEALARVQAAEAAVAHTEAHAVQLRDGRRFTSAEQRDRRNSIVAARKGRMEQLLDSWEDTMAGHTRNLDRLEAVAPAERETWRGSIQGVRGATVNADGSPGGEVSWSEAWDANEDALDTLERAVTVGEALLGVEGSEGRPDGAVERVRATAQRVS